MTDKRRDYRCSVCGVEGHKLWRFGAVSRVDLHCASCAVTAEGMRPCASGLPFDFIDPDFRNGPHKITDQIGRYVPAVPTDDHRGWCSYTAVTDQGSKWWYGLPTYATAVEDLMVERILHRDRLHSLRAWMHGSIDDRHEMGAMRRTIERLRAELAVAAGIDPYYRARAAKIIEAALKVGQHWRDQDGVNALYLDELEQVTREPAA